MGVGHSDDDGGKGYANDGRHDVRGKGDNGVLGQEADEHDQCSNCVKSGRFYDDQDYRLCMKMNWSDTINQGMQRGTDQESSRSTPELEGTVYLSGLVDDEASAE
jgi:hypothetical protein